MEIPPPGTDPGTIANFVDHLQWESSRDPRRKAFLEEAERGLNLYVGNHYTEAATDDEYVRLVLNRIQNCVISLVAIQAGDQPKITFTPRETGETPLYYLNTEIPAGKALLDGMAAQGIDPGEPLPDEVADTIRQKVEAASTIRAQLQAVGQPVPTTLPPENLLVEVTDQTSTQALQTVFDGMWAECHMPFLYAENILNKNVTGWQPTLYEFDDDRKQHVLTNVHGKHVFPDPIYTDFDRAAYAIYDEYLSAAEAKAKWPQFAKQIKDTAKIGTMRWTGGHTYDPGAPYQQTFERGMVIVRTCWLRHQWYPLMPEQAIAGGLAKWKQFAVGPKVLNTDASGNILCAECGAAYVPDSGFTADDACPQCGQPLGAAPTRDALVLDHNGKEVTHLMDANPQQLRDFRGWPMRLGIRQVRVLSSTTTTLDDRECEMEDIPLAANRNVPIPFSPYGQGEPKRLEDLNMAINRILSGMVTHHAYTAFPPEAIPQQVAERLDPALRDMRTKPNKRLEIPRDLAEMVQGDLKKLFATLDVPTLPADFWRLLDLLLKLIDQEGNQADVMQGNAASGWSGDAIKSLQNAASKVIQGKSMYTEFFLLRITNLMVHSIVNRMTPADLKKYLTRYPIQAITAMHTRNKAINRDIAISIKSASGGNEQSQTQNMVAARQMGVPISDATLMERMDIDPDAELSRQAEFQRKQRVLAGAMGQQPQPGANNTGEQAAVAQGQGEPA